MTTLSHFGAHWRWHWTLPQLHGHIVHDLSLSALAAAVAVLGLVLLAELRSVLKLREGIAKDLARVFEQLDLLRFESQQLLEARTQQPPVALASPPVPAEREPRVPTRTDASKPATAGEARLLAALAQARALRARPAAVDIGGAGQSAAEGT